jgi:hypothetical protein
MLSGRKPSTDTLDLFVLSGFAFAQPLFDLLSRNATFFVAHQSKPVDIILLVLGLCLVVPATLVFLEKGTSLIGCGCKRITHIILVSSLVGAVLLPFLKRLERLPGIVLLLVSLALGLAFALTYLRFRSKRVSLVFLCPTLMLFPVLFLVKSPVHRAVVGGEDSSAVYPEFHSTAPVVMVIFDEFPLVSLLDERQGIDSNLFPNFAALSKGSTWYRNATSVSEGTHNAMPAILDGLYPSLDTQLPNSIDHPRTLFTLLGGAYDFHVIENNTRLCPQQLCGDMTEKNSFWWRTYELWRDVSILYAYVLLPVDLTVALPDITQSWKNFRTNPGASTEAKNFLTNYHKLMNWEDRPGTFKRFVNSIQYSSRPTLHFLHVLLPHAPWEYLPSGEKNRPIATVVSGSLESQDHEKYPFRWTNDWPVIVQAYRDHLLQVELVDRLVGELVDHLKRIGLYDPSLIVIAADHGVSFRANEFRRRVSAANYPDIMSVPLFIKQPYQKEGRVDDQNVETIDILPTMADILGIPLSWKLDGQSVLNPTSSAKNEKNFFGENGRIVIASPMMQARSYAVRQKLRALDVGREMDNVNSSATPSELIGSCDKQIDDSAPLTNTLTTTQYKWGDLIQLGKGGNGKLYQAEGWGDAERQFTWIDGKRARIVLPISDPKSAVSLWMRLGAYVVPSIVERQKVRVLVNDQFLEEWVIRSSDFHERILFIPKEMLGSSKSLVITLEVPEAVSPLNIGTEADPRELGIAAEWMKLSLQASCR